MTMFNEKFWVGKRVLLTGHTGFKGSWMSHLLLRLGAEVSGYSLEPVQGENLYESSLLKSELSNEAIDDICNFSVLDSFFSSVRPEIVIHMAAQPLVLEGYNSPRTTFMTNVQGTVNVLDVCRRVNSVESILVVTTDKVYENNDQGSFFVETDRLGGKDPYSASKAACELVVSCFRESYFNKQNVSCTTARAGNVIGGGDWAKHRIIPDIMNARFSGEKVVIRSPTATRPWQHVLEPLTGYLRLLEQNNSRTLTKEESSYNLGPEPEAIRQVIEIVEAAAGYFGVGVTELADFCDETKSKDVREEALTLALDINRIKSAINYAPKWNFETGLNKTFNWYEQYNQGVHARRLVHQDIDQFMREDNAR